MPAIEPFAPALIKRSLGVYTYFQVSVRWETVYNQVCLSRVGLFRALITQKLRYFCFESRWLMRRTFGVCRSASFESVIGFPRVPCFYESVLRDYWIFGWFFLFLFAHCCIVDSTSLSVVSRSNNQNGVNLRLNRFRDPYSVLVHFGM